MSNAPYDAIILLGGGINADGSLMDTAKVRLEKAAWLYANNDTEAIITCGSHSHKAAERPKITEAQTFADYLMTLGVPREHIYLETESQETVGNLLFAKMHILIRHSWTNLIVIPTYSHSTARISYLLKKILGSGYDWEILRVGENKDPANLAREAKSLQYTKDINDPIADGDHEAVYKRLMETHPAYQQR